MPLKVHWALCNTSQIVLYFIACNPVALYRSIRHQELCLVYISFRSIVLYAYLFISFYQTSMFVLTCTKTNCFRLLSWQCARMCFITTCYFLANLIVLHYKILIVTFLTWHFVCCPHCQDQVLKEVCESADILRRYKTLKREKCDLEKQKNELAVSDIAHLLTQIQYTLFFGLCFKGQGSH